MPEPLAPPPEFTGLRILEIIHDEDHPPVTNLGIWAAANRFEIQTAAAFLNPSYPGLDRFELLVLHGGSQHLWDKEQDPWLDRELRFVKKVISAGKPVIGFCLGSQLLAEAMGGAVYQARQREIGWYPVQLRPGAGNHPLLAGLEDGFTSFMWHSDHYHLPASCVSLGFTEAAEHQILISREYPVIGFQFHPEYSKENLRYFLETCPEADWIGDGDRARFDEFRAGLERMPETYPLFRRLMNNALAWFSERFRSAGTEKTL